MRCPVVVPPPFVRLKNDMLSHAKESLNKKVYA